MREPLTRLLAAWSLAQVLRETDPWNLNVKNELFNQTPLLGRNPRMQNLFYSAKGLPLVRPQALLSLLSHNIFCFTWAVSVQLAACQEHRVKSVHYKGTQCS